MGRTRLYASNSERQRHFQQVKKEKELQEQIEIAQKTNTQATQKVENFEESVSHWFSGKTIQEVKTAYESYKGLYKSLGIDVLFMEIQHYLLPETSLYHSINVGQMDQFLESFDPKIKCVVCGYSRSVLESNGCPECNLRLHDYKDWLAYRKSYHD